MDIKKALCFLFLSLWAQGSRMAPAALHFAFYHKYVGGADDSLAAPAHELVLEHPRLRFRELYHFQF